MEKFQNINQQNYDDDIQVNNQLFSLAQYSQMHPYQYLKQLNNVYQTCNRSAGKYYSTASMVKLPWKKFKFVNIPKCFEQSYNLERKETCHTKNIQQNQKSQEIQKQKKFWKQHQDLIRRYHHNNLSQNNMKKRMIEQRKKKLTSAKSQLKISGVRNQCSYVQGKNKSQKQNQELVESFGNGYKQNKNSFSSGNKQNNERFSTIKTQSDQTQTKDGFQIKNSILANQRNMLITNGPSRDKNNIYLKKLIQKGRDLKYDETKLQQQVLEKLRKISIMPNYNRAKTANLPLRQSNKNKDKLLRRQAINKTPIDRTSLNESRIKQGQYLQFNKQEQLINRYKSKIKQIDCSISEKNVKKTVDILRQMQQLADFDVDNY